MRTLVLGGRGMLGRDVVAALESRGHEVVAPSRVELDIAEPASVAQVIAGTFGEFDMAINCAAYTTVDRAETEERLAFEANAIGPGYLAKACASKGIDLIHVSTDFVFDGSKRVPYEESDIPRPLGAYGESKLAGERAILEGHQNAVIVRTAWLYGPHGASFPRTLIRAALAGRELRVVDDQVGSPTYTGCLARLLVEIAECRVNPGIYHAAGPDSMSWRDFAALAIEAWYELEGMLAMPSIAALRTEEWPTPAARPAYSVLSFERLSGLGFNQMASTKIALRDFVQRLKVAHGQP